MKNSQILTSNRKPPQKAKVSKKQFRESLSMGMLAIPGVVLLFLFNYLPMFGIPIAFKNYKPLKGIWGSDWNGLDNFKFFFTSQDAVRTIRNTVCYNLVFIVLGTIAAVTLAITFYSLRNQKALKFYNTVILIPRFLSAVLLSFLVEIFLHARCGLINQFLPVSERVDWYADASFWPYILVVVYLWNSVGMSSVIYYASLVSLDTSLLEAAELDGANKWQQIWNVIIPYLIPVIIIQVILAIGHIYSGDFGLFYQVPQDSGLLYPATDIINTYTFRALRSGSMAKSAAVGLAQSVAGLITVVITNGIIRKVSPEHSLF